MQHHELIHFYPRLWHMAHAGSWPAIRDMGLMSASAILDAYEIAGERRRKLEEERRPQSVEVIKDGLPGAVIRDQKPLKVSVLEACLQDGLSVADWLRFLNCHSFFWVHRERVRKLINARAYRRLEQAVITVDTASLVSAHGDRILLSPINSGATIYAGTPRGRSTFCPIHAFPFAERKKGRHISSNVVELLVPYAVPDIAQHALAVHRVQNGEVVETIWRSQRATDDDCP